MFPTSYDVHGGERVEVDVHYQLFANSFHVHTYVGTKLQLSMDPRSGPVPVQPFV